MSNDLVPIVAASRPENFADLLKAAKSLKPGDAAGVVALFVKVAAVGLSGVQADMLIKAIAKATGAGIKTLRKTWAEAQEEEQRRAGEAGAPERMREAAEKEARRKRLGEEERERLWNSCRAIAESKALLAEMESAAHKLGVVGEGAGVRALYLAYTSRLLVDDAVRVLRLGAPASGKNLVVEKTLMFIPEHSLAQFSGSSPKALAYFGGDNPDALKHKVIYIPEAAILADRREGESDFTIMLRTVISEGRLVYQTVVVQEGGPPATVTIVKNGPIAAIVTTARDVDPELKTRTLVMDTDESGEQTVAIAKRILSNHPEPALDLEPWLSFQAWLELGGPYRVTIPFKEAIFTAFEQWRPKFLSSVALRMRRDVGGLLTAIRAAAVVHKAQRKVEDGAIVAELDDYQAAHEAFDEGLAAVHGKASEKVIAVVTAIEEMNEGADLPVKVTLRELAKRLRVASPTTAGARLNAAIDFGAIDQVDAMSGPGGARYFRVVKTEEKIRAEPGLGVFPPVECVRGILFPEEGGDQTGGQLGQKDKEGTRVRI
jgi:hypothetical protein